jgi:hypothetical protein
LRTIAGAEGTRLSLRPLRLRGHRHRITSGAKRRENAKAYPVVIASEAKQSISRYGNSVDCFGRFAPLRKRFAFVAGNDGERAV